MKDDKIKWNLIYFNSRPNINDLVLTKDRAGNMMIGRVTISTSYYESYHRNDPQLKQPDPFECTSPGGDCLRGVTHFIPVKDLINLP